MTPLSAACCMANKRRTSNSFFSASFKAFSYSNCFIKRSFSFSCLAKAFFELQQLMSLLPPRCRPLSFMRESGAGLRIGDCEIIAGLIMGDDYTGIDVLEVTDALFECNVLMTVDWRVA